MGTNDEVMEMRQDLDPALSYATILGRSLQSPVTGVVLVVVDPSNMTATITTRSGQVLKYRQVDDQWQLRFDGNCGLGHDVSRISCEDTARRLTQGDV